MTKNKLFIPVILGTIRKGRRSEHVARLVFERMRQRDDVDTALLDIRAIGFDFGNEGEDAKIPKFSTTMQRANGYALVSPEYNHSYPGSLKMALDTNFAEYKNKAVAIFSVSKGQWGGVRAVENLVNYTQTLGMKPLLKSVQFPKVGDTFDEDGNLLDDSYNERIDSFLDNLVELATALAPLQKHEPSDE